MRKSTFFLLTALTLYLCFNNIETESISVNISFSLISLLSLLFLNKKNLFNSRTFFHLFNLVFLGFAGAIQFNYNSSYFINYSLKKESFLVTNLFIILLILIFEFSYRLKRSNNFSLREYNITKKGKLFLLTLSVIATSLTIIFLDFNFSELFFREKVSLRNASTTYSLILDKAIRPIPPICFLLLLHLNKKLDYFCLLLGLLSLITFNPLGIPRYATASIYIPALILLAPQIIKKDNLVLIYLFSSFFIFPLLNLFRYSSISVQDRITFGLQGLQSVNFDTYQSLLLTIENGIITYGHQILGVFLFMIPRTIWPTKPQGTGSLIAETNDYIFDNVSANFFAEGYINGGIIGMILFTVFLGVQLKKTDSILWQNNNNSQHVFSLIFLNMVFFILRGDLMSAVAYTISYAALIYIITKTLRILMLTR